MAECRRKSDYCFMNEDWFWSLIISDLRKEKQMAEWIKVSERLPDRKQGYIMICNSDYIGVCDTRVYSEWTDEMYNDYFGNGNIKFWQPLPPLPSEAEK